MSEKILLLAANPDDTLRLKLGNEVRDIEEGLRRSRQRDRFEVGSKWAVRTHDLRRALLDESPRFVHFCGHGAEQEGIYLEDEQGYAQLVKTEALASLFELFSHSIECVILNACYSDNQAEAISQHINYVIGMKQAISDRAAIEFAIGFYDAVGAGRTLEESFKFGQNAIALEGIPEEFTPIIKKKIV